MMRVMREYSKYFLAVVILTFVGTSFFVWGTGSVPGGGEPVATVNGEAISQAEYQRAYQAYVEFFRQVYQERFTEELARRLRISEQVINDLIQERLILQRARAEGIAVSDQEVRARIQAIPAFHQGGQFSRDLYLRRLSQLRLDPGTFEAEVRTELLRKKMEALVKDGIKVSEAEVRQFWETRHERIRAAWVLVESAPFEKGIEVTDAELEAYHEDHRADFHQPERRRIEYALLDRKGLPLPAVTDKEVAAYYREHPGEFERPKQIRVAHILVRVPAVGGSEAEAGARAKAEEALGRIRRGADFAKVAQEVSEDPATAPKGGELGWISQGEMVPAFEQAAFALPPGEVGGPVRTAFGYHLIKVIEAKEAQKTSLKDATPSIRSKLQAEKLARQLKAKAEEAAEALRGAKAFAQEAKRLGLSPREAGPLTKGDPIEGIGRIAEVEEAVFDLAVGGTSEPLQVPQGYAIVRVVERQEARTPPLAEIRDEVAAALRRTKATDRALETAKELAQLLAKGEAPQALARREGVKAGETGFFSRSEPLSDGALAQAIGTAAFGLAAGAVSEPIPSGPGVYVVKVLERQPPDPEGFAKARPELTRQLLELKRTQAWQAWLADLRAQAKIVINAGGQSPVS